MATDTSANEAPAKTASMMSFLIALSLVSVLGAGIGWFLATSVLLPQKNAAMPDVKTVAEGKSNEPENGRQEPLSGKTAVVLDPIIVALGGGRNIWLRIEMSVVADIEAGLGEPVVKTRLASDIAAFLRNLTLNQISGPSGYLHLKDDLLDRARLSTDGKVDEVLISTLVVE